MIVFAEMLEQLKIMETLNLGQMKHGQVELWTEVINSAIPEVTACHIRAAMLSLAGTRSTEVRGQFITPKDVIDAINQESAVLLAAKRERLRQEIRRNGPFITEGIESPSDDVTWRQAATKAFMNGLTRSQAEAHSWQIIGKVPPPINRMEQRQINTFSIGQTLTSTESNRDASQPPRQ